MKARIIVTLKKEVLDPQGKAVESSIVKMGFNGVKNVRVGKVFDLDIEGSKDKALENLSSLSKKLLSNPVIEDVQIELGN